MTAQYRVIQVISGNADFAYMSEAEMIHKGKRGLDFMILSRLLMGSHNGETLNYRIIIRSRNIEEMRSYHGSINRYHYTAAQGFCRAFNAYISWTVGWDNAKESQYRTNMYTVTIARYHDEFTMPMDFPLDDPVVKLMGRHYSDHMRAIVSI